MALPLVRDYTDEGTGLEGWCGACKRERYFPPAEAEALFGREVAVKHAERRLKCPCGASGRTIPGVSLRQSVKDFYRVLRAKGHMVGRLQSDLD